MQDTLQRDTGHRINTHTCIVLVISIFIKIIIKLKICRGNILSFINSNIIVLQ